MSSILKALKKLEHEKTGRIPDALNLNSDILKIQKSPRKLSKAGLVLFTALVFGGGAAIAVYFMKEPKMVQTAATSPAVPAQKNLQTPLPIVKQETPPEEIIVVPAAASPRIKTVREKQVQPAAAPHETVTEGKKSIISNALPPPEKQKSVVESIKIKKELPAVSTVPTLRVNGIAFQPNAADSMAIVNGSPVSRGSVIEGTTVEEIQEDRIRFQRNGERFEIKLGQSNK
ncbi:MAG: general secretion pathway protein GspB [Desulfuromonadaceae bacterium]|nr:general secretion pathway protein GspB [Desulfuromonadaceae bacterium]